MRSLVAGMLVLCCVAASAGQDIPLPPPQIKVEEPPPPVAPPTPPKPAPKPWCCGFEIGAAGASGNATNFKLRTAINPQFKDDDHLLKLDINYAYTSVSEQTTENRALGKLRHERFFGVSPWSWFTQGEIEYDEFKAFDYRLGAHTGVGYTVVKTNTALLKGRFGAGASRKFGGPDEEVRPEALFGIDYEQKISDRQKICVYAEYFPDFADWERYRFEGRANYEILIDPTWNLTLKLGILDRFDSRPAGKKPNDLEYFATLLWRF